MSRSALVLSLALHAAMLAVVGWSSASIFSHAGPGKTGIGVVFSPEDAGGLLAEDTPPAGPTLAENTPPTVEPNFPPPTVAVDVHLPPIAPMDPVPPPITTVTSIPREVPSISPPRKTRTGSRMSGPSGKSQTVSSNAGGGVNGGGAIGSGRVGGGGGGGPGYVPPQFLMRYKPPYPDEARAQKLEGVVLLLVSVDAAGHVTSAQLSHGCGHDVLDRAALAAVRSWRFIPARQADQPISATVEVPIRFHFSA